MSLNQLSQQQLLELLNQLLVQLVPPTSGRGTPGAGLPAIESEVTAETSVVIQKLAAGKPVVPTKIRSILRRPKAEVDVAALAVSQSSEEIEAAPTTQVREPVEPEKWRSLASQ